MSSLSRTSTPIVSANWIYSGLRFLELSQEAFVKNDCSFQEVILFSTLTPLTNTVKHMIPIKILSTIQRAVKPEGREKEVRNVTKIYHGPLTSVH